MVVFYNLCISVGSVVMSSLSFPILFIGVKFGSSFVCFVYLFEISVSFIFSIVYLSGLYFLLSTNLDFVHLQLTLKLTYFTQYNGFEIYTGF